MYYQYHLDKSNPHIHIGVVPITHDGRLSAKILFCPKHLSNYKLIFIVRFLSITDLNKVNITLLVLRNIFLLTSTGTWLTESYPPNLKRTKFNTKNDSRTLRTNMKPWTHLCPLWAQMVHLEKISKPLIFITDKPKVPSTFTPMAPLEAAISR